MDLVMVFLFWISGFIIVWAMGGFQLSMKVLAIFFKKRKLQKDYSTKPTVTVMVVAHNEESVILDKMNNIVCNDYPKDKIRYLVTSDCSTDGTNEIVKKFIMDNPNIPLKLHETVEHKGKTNAQNEAQKLVTSDILVMTDANAMLESNAITELVACFCKEDIAYVCGRLEYINAKDNKTAGAESLYWEGDLLQREIESNIKTITAGNGAIYACRNREYYDFDPIDCHDECMPPYFASHGLRALYNPSAIAKEKAGESIEDELKRKIRMNRSILKEIYERFKYINVIKYGWFSYFYFGHRFCRRLLWICHLVLFVSSIILCALSIIYTLALAGQILFYAFSCVGLKMKRTNKLLELMGYYCVTVYAQWRGVFNCLTGRSKPTWDKAESTR